MRRMLSLAVISAAVLGGTAWLPGPWAVSAHPGPHVPSPPSHDYDTVIPGIQGPTSPVLANPTGRLFSTTRLTDRRFHPRRTDRRFHPRRRLRRRRQGGERNFQPLCLARIVSVACGQEDPGKNAAVPPNARRPPRVLALAVPRPQGSGSGEPCPPSATRGSPPCQAQTAPAQERRQDLLGVALACLGTLVQRPHHRPSRHSGPLIAAAFVSSGAGSRSRAQVARQHPRRSAT